MIEIEVVKRQRDGFQSAIMVWVLINVAAVTAIRAQAPNSGYESVFPEPGLQHGEDMAIDTQGNA